MAKKTKKVGSSGRFQSRYGVKTRTRVKNVEAVQKAKHKCPNCGHQKVKRISTSIWQCKKCKVKFAGGAYIPHTEAGQNVEKILKGELEASEIIKEVPEEIEEELEE